MNTISLSRTVFEIFDLAVFRVWPWPMNPEGHVGSKKIIPFERPYMTSYLTSMDSISLSRTIFEIFDFKVFRVLPWPLSPKGHLGSKKIILFERPYMTSYLTFMDTISLSRTVFEIFDFKVFRVRPWPLTPKGHVGSKKIIPFEKAIYDFLFDFYGHHLSISYRSRDNAVSKFWRPNKMADFDLLKVKVKFRFFSNIKTAPSLTKRRRLRYCASKSVQPFRLCACLRA